MLKKLVIFFWDNNYKYERRGIAGTMKRKVIAFVMAAVLIFIVCISIQDIRKQKIINAVNQYDQETNEQDIAVNLSDNPYFMEKQPGFRYREPETITYPSKITGTDRHAMVFLPADYTEKKQYPVLYLLHGLDGSHRTWKNKSADIIFQNLYYFNDVPEMIIVCPNSAVNQAEDTDDLNIVDKIKAYDLTGKEVVENLKPFIESHYSVKTGRDHTAIAGNSMGGRNALYTAFTYPELFGYVGAFSSAHVLEQKEGSSSILPPLLTDLNLPSDAEDFKLIMLCVGRSDQVCGQVTYELHDYMTEQGIDHIFYDVEGGHSNVVWQNALYNFGRKIFQ